MQRLPHLPRRQRAALLLAAWLFALSATAVATERRTALLASAAPARTPISADFAPLVTPTPEVTAVPLGPAVAVPEANGQLIDDRRFSYEPGWYAPEVQQFLDGQPGPLKALRVTIGDREHSFAEFLVSQTTLYSLNPKVVLALIEQQSGLLSTADASPEQLDWAFGYHGEDEHFRGVIPQARWALRELRRAVREYRSPPELVYADGSHSAPPENLSVSYYAILRMLAATTTPAELPGKLDAGAGSFLAVYSRLFGDGRPPPTGWPEPAAPFLQRPTRRTFPISSFFDHDLPFLRENGSLVSYRGDTSGISYDGHTGWDYALRPPEPVLAAAAGTVVFAGNSDDGCGVAHVVIIDHANGYRTLYWHLSEVLAAPGPITAGAEVGIVGASGCATGPHLHFQVQFLGRDVDPYGWCGPADADPWAGYPAGQRSTWLWQWMPSPCALPADGSVVDTGDAGFHRDGAGWTELAGGAGGAALQVTSVISGPPPALGLWQPTLPAAGRYRVMAWLPYIYNGLEDATAVTYTLTTATGALTITVDQAAAANSWADLGTYDFPASGAAVSLPAMGVADTTNVWYDAIIWIKQPGE